MTGVKDEAFTHSFVPVRCLTQSLLCAKSVAETGISMLYFGLLIPFIGTALGAACVFFIKKDIPRLLQKSLLGFASGVMISASVWSLLIPSINLSADMGKLSVIPAVVGFFLGILFLLAMDAIIPHLHLNESKPEGLPSNLKRATMLILAVTLHNIPEGMAVGVVLAGMLDGNSGIESAAALVLAVGIAIQNFPEGLIVALPLRGEGKGRGYAFLCGTLSGIVEPIAAVITILLIGIVSPVLPYFLSFAAGAMVYVVVEELLPEASEGEHTNLSTIFFAIGFVVMMVLDVALG